MKYKYIVLDCETGGLDEQLHPITQIAWQVLDAKTLKVLKQNQLYVKPYANLTITEDAIKHSRIDLKEVKNGVSIEMLIRELIALSKFANPNGRDQNKPVIVGHNISFDMRFLRKLFALKEKNFHDYYSDSPLDTLKILQFLENDSSRLYNLGACCERFGIKLKEAHGALPDVIATTMLFKEIRKNNGKSKVSSSNEVLAGDESEESGQEQRVRTYFEFG